MEDTKQDFGWETPSLDGDVRPLRKDRCGIEERDVTQRHRNYSEFDTTCFFNATDPFPVESMGWLSRTRGKRRKSWLLRKSDGRVHVTRLKLGLRLRWKPPRMSSTLCISSKKPAYRS